MSREILEHFPITFDEFIKGEFYGKDIKGFLIDNTDLLLVKMARGIPLEAISITTSPEKCYHSRIEKSVKEVPNCLSLTGGLEKWQKKRR